MRPKMTTSPDFIPNCPTSHCKITISRDLSREDEGKRLKLHCLKIQKNMRGKRKDKRDHTFNRMVVSKMRTSRIESRPNVAKKFEGMAPAADDGLKV